MGYNSKHFQRSKLPGFPLVLLSEITRTNVEHLSELIGGYLFRSVRSNGRIVYIYDPNRGEENTARNNSIRQWMATRALIRSAEKHPDREQLANTIRRNIQYNLSSMYRERGDAGWIEESGKIKLGAIALAALTLKESPWFGEYAETYHKLCNTVRAMWQDNGKFRTFLAPVHRDDCHNFYPGEALLLWANILGDSIDKYLLECFSRSFYYYGDWHRQNRNPAFVPWHTMAYAKLWDHLPDPKLVDAIFDMNDWLLGIQQWDDAPSEDCRGRFYAPDRPFGPPHASSTAVYLEGLAEAFRISKLTSDVQRQQAYRTSILRGLRSLAQLTYKDESDMSFITKRDQVLGGVRTCEYNNIIRIDNVQHSMMAILRILEVFDDADWQNAAKN